MLWIVNASKLPRQLPWRFFLPPQIIIMMCPLCHVQDTRVLDSRLATDGMSIRRRRTCQKCDFRFSTIEETHILDLPVVKRDGRREPYSREKLLRGLDRALEKRAITRVERKALLQKIEVGIQKLKKQEITSTQLGEVVMKALKKFDKVAYIRFASVYRHFEDVKTFQKELALLIPKRKIAKKKK
jgi:transcriptional repressor NrdR